MKKELILFALLAGSTSVASYAQTSQVADKEQEKSSLMPVDASSHYSYATFEKNVLDYSQTLKQSTSQQMAMKSAVKVAKTGFLPSVDAAGNYQYRLNDMDLPFGDFAVPIKKDAYSAGFQVMQPVFVGGSVIYNYKGQKIQSSIAEQGVELTKDNVIYAAESSYWGAAAQKEMYLVMCKYSDIVGQLLGVLQDRYNDGLISKTDLIQMEVRKKEADLQQLNALERFQLAMQNMNVLMGKAPMDSIDITESVSKHLDMPSLTNVDDVFTVRPDLAISKLDVDYQKNQIKLSTVKYNPSLAVGYQGAWGTKMLNVNGDKDFNHSLVVSLKIPLFHWGARFKQTAAQKALYNKSCFALQDKKDQVSKEVAASWTQLVESKKKIEVAQKNCMLADENLELNTFSYTEGRLSILDVLSAQLTWIQAYTNLIQSHYQEKIAMATYNKASGSRYIK